MLFIFMLIALQPALAQNDFNTFIQDAWDEMPRAQTDAYVQPDEAALDDFELAISAIKDGDTDLAATYVADYDYEVIEMQHSLSDGRELDLIILHEEEADERGWGTYAYNPDARFALSMQIPHPLFEPGTMEMGRETFLDTEASWFLMAGTHRCANAETDECPDRDADSDMSHNENSVFQRVHETIQVEDHYQLHGFNEHNEAYEGYPEIILSNGTTDPSNIFFKLQNLFEDNSFETGVYKEETKDDLSLLAATQNVQGQAVRDKDDEFVHFEFANFIRTDENIRPDAVDAMVRSVAAMEGEYTVGAEGTDGGVDPDFTNLNEAFDQIMSEGINDDVTLLITSDIEQQENVAFGFDASPHQITLRPDEETEPTITFTAEEGNDTYNGSLILGLTEVDGGAGALAPTSNITIDGSNNGTDSRDLTLQTTNDTGSLNSFRIIGENENITIKNTNFIMNQDGQAWDAIDIRTREAGDGSDQVPVNIVLENNYIENYAATSARTIALQDFGSPNEGASVIIRNNDLRATRYGVWFRDSAGDGEIVGNDIIIDHGTAGSHGYGIFIEDTVDDNQQILVQENRISDSQSGVEFKAISLESAGIYEIRGNIMQNLSASETLTGVYIGAGGEFSIDGNRFYDFNGDDGINMISFQNNLDSDHDVFIANNLLTGFSSEEGDGEFLQGVVIRSPDGGHANVRMYHNTLVMNPLDVSGSGWNYRGLSVFSNSAITLDLKNNIFINNDNNGSEVESYAYYQSFSASADLTTDFNVWYGSHFSEEDETYLSLHESGNYATTLAEHQEHTGSDENSVSKQVEFVSNESPFDLRLAGESDGDRALSGAPLENVQVDFEGNERNPERPYKGAHEAGPYYPELIILSGPEHEADDVSITPAFEWLSSEFANYYQLRLATDEEVTEVILDETLSDTTFTPGNELESEQTYYWKVRGINEGREGEWSEVYRFTTELSVPEQVSLADPENELTNVTQNPVFTWHPAKRGETYKLEVSDEPGFDEPLISEALTDTSYTVSESLDDYELFYWRVRAENEAGNGPWSEHFSFTTRFLIAEFSIVEPEDQQEFQIDGGSDAEVTFAWNKPVTSDSDEVQYYWQLFEPDEYEDPVSELLSRNEGADTTISVSHETIDGILSELDVEESETVELEWTVLAKADEVEQKAVDNFQITFQRSTATGAELTEDVPEEFNLLQNYPNPFNPATTIAYELPEETGVQIIIYDMLGRKVDVLVDENQAAGHYTVQWDGSDAASGQYLYRIEAGGFTTTRQMTLIK